MSWCVSQNRVSFLSFRKDYVGVSATVRIAQAWMSAMAQWIALGRISRTVSLFSASPFAFQGEICVVLACCLELSTTLSLHVAGWIPFIRLCLSM